MEDYIQLINKAKNFYKINKFEEAKISLLKVINNFELESKIKLNILLLLADTLSKLNNFQDVKYYLFEYQKINPNNSGVLNMIANNFLRMKDFKKAEEYYLKSVSINEKNETALINLAILLENLGRNSESLKFYKKALNLNPKNLSVLYNMSKLDKKIPYNQDIPNIEKFIKSGKDEYFNIASGYFLLAKKENEKKNFKKEVFFLEKANHYSFKSKDKVNKQALNYWFEIIPNKFDKFYFLEQTKNQNKIENMFPIFIIGLPRSGSTVTEQIISSGKNEIEDLGETNLINWSLLNTHRNELFEEQSNIDKIEVDISIILKKLLNSYKNLNVSIKDKKVFFLDKSLENFYYVDLILRIFPNAKFIHTHRDIRDNVFAIYKEFLSQISWSHSINDIIRYVDNYLKVIEKQLVKNEKKILSISLEDLTKNPKRISQKIYEFCNLDWDENCINFHKRDDLFSKTASSNQIRSGIKVYDKKKYEDYDFLIKDFEKDFEWLKS